MILYHFLELILVITLIINRSAKQQDSTFHVHSYGNTTASGTLQRHLFTSHTKEWIEECERQDLTIKSEAGLKAVAAYHGVKSKPQTLSRPQFTPECFVDAIADFIVTTDQVFFSLFFFS